ncbi:unnamed protein product [Medioppia subpectinata]|uniref:Nuclear receptor domain-containing protein n=1 Tax=Medioppia subpectinata TaxID=1979941 RepID=A0A7R9KK87_9ACAR|nr:unnamed protein product [Medioppia subpectinata]CAG2105247.1 unnamed protein product [Medioppia subpectinata]
MSDTAFHQNWSQDIVWEMLIVINSTPLLVECNALLLCKPIICAKLELFGDSLQTNQLMDLESQQHFENPKITKQLKCGFEGKCNITPNTRKYCQKCRLNKCFAVGMRKEIMNSDEENKRRRQMIAENKQKCIQNVNSNDNKISDQTVGQEVDDLIDSTFYITDKALNKQILEIENTLNNDFINETNDDNIIQKSMPLPLVPVFKELTDYNGLNQLETNRMRELLKASDIINYPIADNVIVVQNKDHLIRMAAPATETHVQNFLTAITLFNPNVPNISHTTAIKLEQQLYKCTAMTPSSTLQIFPNSSIL